MKGRRANYILGHISLLHISLCIHILLSVTVGWFKTFIHSGCRLLVGRNTTWINISYFARGKGKITVPEKEGKQSKFW